MRHDALGLFWQDLAKVKKPKKQKTKRMKPPRLWENDDYLPYLEEALAFDVPLFTDAELMAAQAAGETLVFDIECYPNYFLVAFKSIQSGKVTYVETYDGKALDVPKLAWICANFLIISFNGIGYDIPMASIAIAGRTTAELKMFSDMIIQTDLRTHVIMKKAKTKLIVCNHIDIMEVAPLSASLKIYSGRIHSRRMQDLPFRPEVHLNSNQIDIVRLYCINDLDNTMDLYSTLEPDIHLRIELGSDYDVEVRSKSDAQTAETIFKAEIKKLTNKTPYRPNLPYGYSFLYQKPHFIKYESPLMKWVLQKVVSTPFALSEAGEVMLPPELSIKININRGTYTLGVGGLHSTEKSVTHYADANHILSEHDVVSYYPFIIINQRLYPKHLGPAFLKVYIKIVMRRLEAKRKSKDMNLSKAERKKYKRISNSLKIVINGSFGKLGSKWSILYSPDLLIQVTITGQLSLLMLIERLELAGIPVVSANTDGIVVKCPKELMSLKYKILAQWESETQFELDETEYDSLHSRDVNNYIAVKPVSAQERVKSKGAYASTGLQKNPTNFAAVLAVQAYLTEGKAVAETIREITDVRHFLTVRAVKGGAVFCRTIQYDETLPYATRAQQLKDNDWMTVDGGMWVRNAWKDTPNYEQLGVTMEGAFETGIVEYGDFLGKAIRWYYSSEERGQSEIVYAKSGNKVPRSDGAKPLMDLTGEIPNDIDYEWYTDEATKMLEEIGAIQPAVEAA